VGFHVLVRNVAQAETNVLICCGGLASFPTTTLLVACGVLHCGDATELVNNILYLLMMHNTVVVKENCEKNF
jgi:hypothetical protein